MSLKAAAFGLGADDFARLRALAFSRGGVLEREGSALYSFGTADELALPDGLADTEAVAAVTEHLGAIASGKARPIATGALPFRPDEPAVLRIPEVTVLGRHGSPEAVVVAGDPAVTMERLLVAASSEPDEGEPPDGFSLYSDRSHADFRERVAKAVSEISSGRLEKVVLARRVRIEANRPFRQADILERLRSLHPSCLTFALEGFVGATPELLLAREEETVRSHPLAGTAARSGDPEADARAEQRLLSSEKEQAEHRAVVEAIAAGLGPVTEHLEVPGGPAIVSLRNVSHLGTFISGSLRRREDGSLPSALEAVALVHPTPAVCGTPTDTALEYILKEEELERGRYAGPVGWVRSDGDGEFHLGIRCGTVEKEVAELYAGAGIVADSDPGAELAETQLKFQAMLAALVRP